MSANLSSAAAAALLPSRASAAVLSERELLELMARAGDLLGARAEVLEDRDGCRELELIAGLRDLEAQLQGPAIETVQRLFRRLLVAV